MTETLIAVAHGTRSPLGRRQIQDLVAAVARRRPGLDVRLCYVDVQEPRVAEIVPMVRHAVVVPLLLSCGYHLRVDIAEAVTGTNIPVTGPLGPDPLLLESLRRSLPDADAVVLAAAGSSDARWRADVGNVAAELGAAAVGYTSGGGPRVADVVAQLRADGAKRVAIAAYLLAEGVFYRTLHTAGADFVTPPLCRDPAVTDLVLRRFDAARLRTGRLRTGRLRTGRLGTGHLTTDGITTQGLTTDGLTSNGLTTVLNAM